MTSNLRNRIINDLWFSFWAANPKSTFFHTLFHYSLLLITSKAKASFVKRDGEEVISKPQRLTSLGLWQRNRDSNPNKQSQSLSCYLYTIPLYFQREILYPIHSKMSIAFPKKQTETGKIFLRRISARPKEICPQKPKFRSGHIE